MGGARSAKRRYHRAAGGDDLHPGVIDRLTRRHRLHIQGRVDELLPRDRHQRGSTRTGPSATATTGKALIRIAATPPPPSTSESPEAEPIVGGACSTHGTVIMRR